jgi:hypothetical protein
MIRRTRSTRGRPIAGFRRHAALAAALALAAFASGCSEWKKYWRESPTGPEAIPDTTPPVVALLSPAGPDSAHATPVSGGAFPIAVEATDDVGLARVVVFVDGGPGVEVAGPGFTLDWDTKPLADGSVHRLWAMAADGAGNLAFSDTAYAQVFHSGPELAIVDPAAGALVKGTVPLAVQFVGAVPGIRQVEFIAGAVSLGSVTAAPWTLMAETAALADGDQYVTARATTEFDQVGVSQPVRIRVNNATPQLTIDFPADGHRVATRGTLILSGSATDVVEGALPAAGIAWTSSRDGALGTGRYLRRANLSPGTHTITAAATNSWGTTGQRSIAVEVLAAPTWAYSVIHDEIVVGRACIGCHTPGTSDFRWSLLDMNSYELLMAGGRSADVYESIAPCRPESSLVWNKLTEEIPWVGEPMPPRAQYDAVPADLLAKLRTWILEGAPPDAP